MYYYGNAISDNSHNCNIKRAQHITHTEPVYQTQTVVPMSQYITDIQSQ
jgi:hypothetical protein